MKPTDQARHKSSPQIFLCYAKEDSRSVYPVHDALKQVGFDAWIDTEKLKPGQDWKHEIERAINSADFVVLFLSSTSVRKRGYVQTELKLALDVLKQIPENQVFVIPTRIDECDVPTSLQRFQYCEMYRDGVAALVSAVEAAWADHTRDNPALARQFERFRQEGQKLTPLAGQHNFGTLKKLSRFVRLQSEVLDKYGALSTRLSVDSKAKERSAYVFCSEYLKGVLSVEGSSLFIESGSTMVYFAEALTKHIGIHKELNPEHVRIFTNNALAYINLVQQGYSVTVFPEGPVDPYYGATYGELSALPAQPPQQFPTSAEEKRAVNQLAGAVSRILGNGGLICVSASRFLPHPYWVADVQVGNYYNKLGKLALFSTGLPVALFIDGSKWMTPSPVGSPYHIFSDNLSLAYMLRDRPVALISSFTDPVLLQLYFEYFTALRNVSTRCIEGRNDVTTIIVANDAFQERFNQGN